MRKWMIAGVAVLLVLVVAGIALRPAMHRLVRERTQKVLEAHFASTVEFSDFDVTMFPRLRVTINGLVLRHKGRTDIPPLIEVKTVSVYAQLRACCSPGHTFRSYSWTDCRFTLRRACRAVSR